MPELEQQNVMIGATVVPLVHAQEYHSLHVLCNRGTPAYDREPTRLEARRRWQRHARSESGVAELDAPRLTEQGS